MWPIFVAGGIVYLLKGIQEYRRELLIEQKLIEKAEIKNGRLISGPTHNRGQDQYDISDVDLQCDLDPFEGI